MLEARRGLLALADRLVPAEVALFDHSVGLARTHVIGTLAELGVADELARAPATAEDLAGRLGVDADALHRVLRAAAQGGMLRLERNGVFSLGRTGQPLRSDHPHPMRDWARYMSLKSTSAAWSDLTETVRTGRAAFPRVHGRSIWQWFGEHPEEERVFAGGMRTLTAQAAPFIVHGYPWPEEGVLCDVAGGVGTLLGAILDARPRLRGVLVEGAGVLAEADGWLADRGLRERVELSGGDIFRSLSVRADVYLLKNILHDWDDEACATILGVVRATMPKGARLVVVEYLQERNVPDPVASRSDLQMMTQCDNGRERSAEEIQSLLGRAGLRPGSVVRTGGPGLVEAFA